MTSKIYICTYHFILIELSLIPYVPIYSSTNSKSLKKEIDFLITKQSEEEKFSLFTLN